MYTDFCDTGVTVHRDDCDSFRDEGDFFGFVCDLYNCNEMDALHISEIQSAGNDNAGYFIILCGPHGTPCVWVDPYDYREIVADGSVYLPFQWDVYTDEEIDEIFAEA